MNQNITTAELEGFEKGFAADPAKRVAQLAVTANGVNKSATDPLVQREDRHQFSIQLEAGKITNQKSSGRCWMFAALNTMRVEIIKKLNLDVSFQETCKTQDGPTFQHEKMWKTPGNGLNTRFFRGKPLAYC